MVKLEPRRDWCRGCWRWCPRVRIKRRHYIVTRQRCSWRIFYVVNGWKRRHFLILILLTKTFSNFLLLSQILSIFLSALSHCHKYQLNVCIIQCYSHQTPGSISPFYMQLLCLQIPKAQKRQSSQAAFWAFGIFEV